MSHVDKKLDNMTQMLQQVFEMQKFQYQVAHDTTASEND